MFTGIIEEQGVVEKIGRKENLAVLHMRARKVVSGTSVGDSVSVNGVCLTVTAKKATGLSFEVMKETLKSTTLGLLNKGSRVNLERALKANSRVGGHFVTGHVDCVGKIAKRVDEKNFTEFQVRIPAPLMPFIVEKGSVCLDGISLTVGKVRKQDFSVYIIPHTVKVTTIGKKQKGDTVNVETDLLAKYLAEFLKVKL